MIVYVVTTILSMTLAACAWRNKRFCNGDRMHRMNYKIFAVLSILPFVVVSTIRYEVGTDWYIYTEYFYAINEGWNEFSEPLFNLLNKIVYIFSDNSQHLIALVAILTLIFTFIAIYDQSSYVPFSILLFVLTCSYFISLNQIRQALAMAIFAFASKYIWKRKPIQYFIWILIAAGMHTSALLYIPIYFIYGRRFKLKTHITVLAAVLVGLPIIKRILIALISLTKYGWYFDSNYAKNDGFLLAGFLVNFLILVLFEYYYYMRGKDVDDKYIFMVHMQLLTVIALLFTTFIPQGSRIAGALQALNILGIPMIPLLEQNRNRRIVVYMIIVALFVMYMLYNVYICGFYNVIPYQTIFNK